ncbi:hypothetical protein IFJ82_09670 [Novacetimonas hansenii]|uniref:hypothetical protein n=1 Tax=Novacetimonas hansenii TaxID=436 RepID=UPI001783A6E1|nr:hypothetical protein [Novacetimonas hansenii]QOF94219.1 hypothetical protein IFJ82_09670 [Novacetimonas hansenii]
MTPDEAYATLFGVPDPIQSGKQWADAVWGVDGLPLREAKRLVQAEAEAMRDRLKDAPCSRFEHEGIPLVDRHVDYFTVAAKARLYDLYMARQHHRGHA